MARDNWNENDQTEWQKCESPILCANNCGFFGSAMTNNLCSKCYRDLVMKQQVLAAVQPTALSSSTLVEPALPDSEKLLVAITKNPGKEQIENPSMKHQPQRCLICRKKVGLTGFKCRCENTFCSAHRYPETHDCSFDFKSSGREAIAKDNPVVKAEKIDKI